MAVEVGICVEQGIYLDLDDWAVLIRYQHHQKGEGGCPSACLPDDCQLGTTDRQADRTHGDVEAACRVDRCASVLVVSNVAPVFSLSIAD